jgi:hypothetical protein
MWMWAIEAASVEESRVAEWKIKAAEMVYLRCVWAAGGWT